MTPLVRGPHLPSSGRSCSVVPLGRLWPCQCWRSWERSPCRKQGDAGCQGDAWAVHRRAVPCHPALLGKGLPHVC